MPHIQIKCTRSILYIVENPLIVRKLSPLPHADVCWIKDQGSEGWWPYEWGIAVIWNDHTHIPRKSCENRPKYFFLTISSFWQFYAPWKWNYQINHLLKLSLYLVVEKRIMLEKWFLQEMFHQTAVATGVNDGVTSDNPSLTPVTAAVNVVFPWIGWRPVIHLSKGWIAGCLLILSIDVDGSGDGGQWWVDVRRQMTRHWPPSPLPSTLIFLESVDVRRSTFQTVARPFQRWIAGCLPILSIDIDGGGDGGQRWVVWRQPVIDPCRRRDIDPCRRRRRRGSTMGRLTSTRHWPLSPPPLTSIQRIGRQPAIHLLKGGSPVDSRKK